MTLVSCFLKSTVEIVIEERRRGTVLAILNSEPVVTDLDPEL